MRYIATPVMIAMRLVDLIHAAILRQDPCHNPFCRSPLPAPCSPCYVTYSPSPIRHPFRALLYYPIMKIAIIGCGYVGSALGKTLAVQRHDVVGTTTTPSRTDELRQLGLTPALLDVSNVDQLHNLLADREAVYLTIAPTRRGTDYRDVYLAAAKALATATENTSAKRIIYTGSTRIYGQDDGSWVDETSPTDPRDENGRILLQTEQTLLDMAAQPGAAALRATPRKPVNVTVLRLGGIYGPDRDYRRRIRGLAGTTRTDGNLYVNLIHLDDIVQALVALLTVPYHGVLNLVDDSPEQRRAMYDRTLNEVNLPPIQWHKDEEATGLGKRVSNDLIKQTLGITLMHPTH